MSIVINVGMDGTTREAAMAVILPLFTRCCVEFCTAPTGEDTLVVAGESKKDGWGTAKELQSAAKRLDQDCIAVYWPILNDGMLIGPLTDAWGEFDLGLFVFPDWMRLKD